MKLLFLDFETQGSDPKTHLMTEIGASLVDYRGVGQAQEEAKLSELVYDASYPAQTSEIVEITSITDEMLRGSGLSPRDACLSLLALMERADHVLAHNVSFDRTLLEKTLGRVDLLAQYPEKSWICTVLDVPWPRRYKCKKLAHLAYDHGILVPPKELHRAYNDVALLSQLIVEHYPIEEILAYRDSPWFYLRAQIPGPWVGNGGDGGIGKAQAQKLGYSWEKCWGTEQPVFPKCWVKRVKEEAIPKEIEQAPFPVFELKVSG